MLYSNSKAGAPWNANFLLPGSGFKMKKRHLLSMGTAVLGTMRQVRPQSENPRSFGRGLGLNSSQEEIPIPSNTQTRMGLP